ncbi:hypothetical protein SDC9_75739 [bioreactor metagenome]|uniref:DUF3888 domain-containing protein n=1 Tax=bioreactor metagenome TaxID=1076179 RepID=A0A644YLJ1_9ZZZZ
MNLKGRIIKSAVLFTLILILLPGPAKAAGGAITDDPARLKDMIVVLLMPAVNQAASDFYEPYLTISPTVAPYYGTELIAVSDEERSSERIYNPYFAVIIEVFPYVGPHLSVGKDRITLGIMPSGTVTVEKYEHLESHGLPSNYASIIKKQMP